MASYHGASGSFPFQQHASTSGLLPQQPAANKSSVVNLAVLDKAREILNGMREKDAQMVPDLKDTLAGRVCDVFLENLLIAL